MFKDALKLPAVVAAKFTVVVQLAEIGSVAPQLVVSVKLLALLPVIVIPLIVSEPLPVLVSVTDCAVAVAPATMLGKVSVVTLKLATGVGAVVVPLSATVAGFVAELLAIDSVAE